MSVTRRLLWIFVPLGFFAALGVVVLLLTSAGVGLFLLEPVGPAWGSEPVEEPAAGGPSAELEGEEGEPPAVEHPPDRPFDELGRPVPKRPTAPPPPVDPTTGRTR
jgi:hypothetical protein